MPGCDIEWRRRGRFAAVAVLCLAGWLPPGQPLAAELMYRYADERGEPVYSYTLPPDQAPRGYQKIDAQTGQVVETVAPKLSPEEFARKREQELALQACREELERIYTLYGSERDIERALNDTLTSLNTRIDQLEGSLRQARREQDRLQRQAADAERAGRDVPRPLLRSIDSVREQIDNLQQEIEQRRREREQARTRHRHDLERYRDGTCPDPGTLADAGG